MRTLIIIPFLIFSIEWGCASYAADYYKPTSAEIDNLLHDEELWYGEYYNDVKIGWSSIITKNDLSKNHFNYRYHFYTEGKFEGNKEVTEFIIEEIYENQHPYRLLEMIETYKVDNTISVKRGTRENNDFKLVFEEKNNVRNELIKDFQLSLYEAYSMGAWYNKNRKIGDKLKYKSYSFDHFEYIISIFEVLDIVKKKTSGVDNFYYKSKDLTKYPDGTLTKSEFLTDENLVDIYWKNEDGSESRLETKDKAQNFDYEADLYVNQSLEVTNNIPYKTQSNYVSKATFEINGNYENQFETGKRQQIIDLSEDKKLLILNNLPLDTENKFLIDYMEKGTEDDVKMFLKANSIYPFNDPKIQNLKSEITKKMETNEIDDWTMIWNISNFVSNYIENSYVHNSASIFDIIETKKGDCSEHAHLFTTIARSFGFPTRTVGGYAYGEGTYGLHAWNEVLIEIENEGLFWLPIDSTWDLMFTNMHIKEKNDARPINNLSLTLKEIVYENGEIQNF